MSIARSAVRVVALCSLALAARPASGTEATALVSVLVTDAEGRPQAGLLVFAADGDTDRIAGMATADAAGQVQLTVPRRRHNFGVLSATFGVERLLERGRNAFTLVVKPLPAGIGSGNAAPDEKTAQLRTPRAMVVRGRVLDELGVGLEGVRIEGVRRSGGVAAVAMSGSGGRFALAFPGGAYSFRASAPGLKTTRVARQGEHVIVVMGVAVEAQTVQIHAGHVLSFRLEDSMDPEYFPPPQVRAWLDYAYGICPTSDPLTAAQKRGMKKYWYLDVLRREPPNPATISSWNCTPPSMVDTQSAAVTDGFGPLGDGLGGNAPPRAARDPKAN